MLIIKDRAALQTQANQLFPDNGAELISAADLRTHLSDLHQSVQLKLSDTYNLTHQTTAAYHPGDIILFQNQLFVCIAPAFGAFNPQSFQRITTHLERFTQLADTPQTYTGQAGKLLSVNQSESGLEFVDSFTNATSYNFENDFLIGQGLPTIFNSLGAAQYLTEGSTSPTNGLGVYRLQANASNAVAQLGYFQAGGVPVTPFIRNQISEHKQFVRFSINQGWTANNRARIVFAFAGTAGWQYNNGFQTLPNACTLIIIEPDVQGNNPNWYTVNLIQRNFAQTNVFAGLIEANTVNTLQLNWTPNGVQAFINGVDMFGGIISSNNTSALQCGVIFGVSRINTPTISGNFIVDVDYIKVQGKLNNRTINIQ